ncbi:MAG: hypothetical protein GY820_19440 [Gammaproteobacteria bacterium]|nr:hypothetical protein [Gammaproteobacteria bacterium]
MRHSFKIASLLVMLGLAIPGFSQNAGHRKPPKNALEACSQASSGSQCSFSGRGGENVSGSCFAPQDDVPLACKPEGGRPPPPPESEDS